MTCGQLRFQAGMEKNFEVSIMRKLFIKKYTVPISLCLSLFLYPYPVSPSETEPQSETELNWVIKNIKENEKNLKTFTAKFSQTKKTSLLREPLHSEGIIYFDSSGKMLLKVISPSPLITLLKDGRLLTYYPDVSKTEERYLGGTDTILKKYFGIGQSIEELRKQYAIQLVSKTYSKSYHLKLIPKTKPIKKYIDSIEVVVSPKHWLPNHIHFKETKGDYTSLKLNFISINEPLPQGIFQGDFPKNDEGN
jgi:outer membrane lipoprotein-sorting protein